MPIRISITQGCTAVLVAFTMGITPSLTAQQVTAPTIDVAVTYAAARAIHTTGGVLWLPAGGGVEISAHLSRGLGIAASATGLHASSSSAGSDSLDLVVVAFGPTYTLRPSRRVSIVSEALAGEANGFHSVFAYGSGPTNNPAVGTTDSANSFALQTGGAVDIRLTHQVWLRAAQVDYLRTQLPNGGDDIQNNLRLAAGLVVKFGR